MSSPEPPLQLFRIAPGPVVHTTDNAMSHTQLCEEVDYLTEYADKMAECLGARGFELGLVEDATTQTAFYRIPVGPGLGHAVVNGIVSKAKKKPFSDVLKELWDE
jgi:hypothetical protein